MDSTNFNLSCPPPPLPNRPPTGYIHHQRLLPPHQQWNWESQQYLPNHVGPVPEHFHANQLNTFYPPPPLRPHGYNAQVPRGRFLNNNQFMIRPPQTCAQTQYKRTRSESEDLSGRKSKSTKKKKKRNVQSEEVIKNWNLADALHVLSIEKEYNQLFSDNSLIIKFPDLELDRHIVANFHSAIENVHFQQPSSARFCYVALKESVDANSVIAALNKQQFGEGYLLADHKPDRDDEMDPKEVDHQTLYLGNLAEEITELDLKKAFPTATIRFGATKKMKHTRHAFLHFSSTAACVETFKQTFRTEMFNKKLIVRFRRYKGTAGMPGESKPQNPPKGNKPSTSRDVSIDVDEYCSEKKVFPVNNNKLKAFPISSDVTDHERNNKCTPTIKPEPSDNEDRKPNLQRSYISPFVPGPIDNKFVCHKPKIKVEIKTEIKTETPINIDHEPHAKQEAPDPIVESNMEDYDYQNDYYEYYNGSDSGEEEILDRPIDFEQLYQNMGNHEAAINSLRETDSV